MTDEQITAVANAYTAGILNSSVNPEDDALSGDIVIVVTPAVATRPATTAAFSRTVNVALKSSEGRVHSWFDGTLPVSIADTSTAGTATIAGSATSVTLTNGVGNIVVNGSAHAWLAGVAQVETATCAGTVTTAGNAKVTVTSAGMTGSPKDITVALAENDDAATIATKIRAALTADTAVSGKFVVSGATDEVILTAKAKAANDATFNIAMVDDTSVGVTTAASSANTTAGVAPETNTLTVSKNTSVPLLGSVAAVTSVETIV